MSARALAWTVPDHGNPTTLCGRFAIGVCPLGLGVVLASATAVTRHPTVAAAKDAAAATLIPAPTMEPA